MDLAIFGVLASVVGAYYYIRIVKVMYFDKPAEGFDRPVGVELSAVLAGTGIVTLLFFAYPGADPGRGGSRCRGAHALTATAETTATAHAAGGTAAGLRADRPRRGRQHQRRGQGAGGGGCAGGHGGLGAAAAGGARQAGRAPGSRRPAISTSR